MEYLNRNKINKVMKVLDYLQVNDLPGRFHGRFVLCTSWKTTFLPGKFSVPALTKEIK